MLRNCKSLVLSLVWYLCVVTSFETKSKIISFKSAGFVKPPGSATVYDTLPSLCLERFCCPAAPKHAACVLTIPVPDLVFVRTVMPV